MSQLNLSALQAPVASTHVFIVRLFMLLLVTCCVGYMVLSLNSPVLVRTMQGGTGPETSLQPYTLATSEDKSAYLTFTLRYFAWQNGTFSFEMNDACIKSIFIAPVGLKAHLLKLPESKPLCGAATIDLSPFLIAGVNSLSLEIISYREQETAVYAAPVLLGAHATSTLAVLCIFAVLALTLFTVAQRAGLDRPACFILVVSFTCYALLLHLRPNLEYTNDLTGHIAYIRYMLDNGLSHPYGYNGWEHVHPPLYYFLSSLMFCLGDDGGTIGPLTLVRVLSLFFYMTFLLFGLLTLRAVSQGRSAVYYAGVLLLVFWPIGPVVATRINNDIAVYAAWAAAFYFLVRWFSDDRLCWFQLAIVFTGITFMFKSSGFMMIAVTGACVLWRLVMRKLLWGDLIRKRSLLAFGVFLLGVLENTGRYIGLLLYGGNTGDYLTDFINEKHPLSYYLEFSYSDYVANPVVTFDREPAFLNYFLKTVLYNEQQLDDLKVLPGVLNVLLLVLVTIVTLSALLKIFCDRKGRNLLVPLILGTLIPPVGPFIFMLMKRYMFCQSFRFIVPVLVAFLGLYIRALEPAAGIYPNKLLYRSSIVIATLMVVISVLINGWLYSNGHFQ